MFCPAVAIIGSCGRTGGLFTKGHFAKMVEEARRIITEVFKLKRWKLVSGGAAWSDHVAVALMMKGMGDSLTLHVPYKIYEGKLTDAQSDRLHRVFSETIGRDSISDLNRVNARVKTWKSYKERNDQIAKEAAYLIAFSWSEGNRPESGGTKYTWDKAKNCIRKFHVSLNKL